MKKVFIVLITLVLTLGFFTSCKDEESLEGTTWIYSISSQSSYGNVKTVSYFIFETESIVMMKTEIYIDDILNIESDESEASYRIDGDRVIITMTTSQGTIDIAYIKDKNKLISEFDESLVYKRQ